ncbi:hypothetical protein [uncultured Lacinutrix sp.]|uniref:hypothetical protein n=1 Tax=uncultured Lacinutrix sp. TaxID=574032 RepID=UPI00262DAB1C|nr:hypothetical protein [uncultured Lacinutrix sp.]
MKRLQNIILGLSAILAIIIIIDFSFTGQTIEELTIDTKAKLERYYNAGGNSHTSHRVITENYNFLVTEAFQDAVEDNTALQLAISPIFNEVNSAKITKTQQKETYSLRIYSGLIFPLLLLIALVLFFKFPDRLTIITFILVILNIANFTYLCF